MTDITTRLRAAVGEEPPMSFGAADVITAGRRARRRRRVAYSVAAGAAAAAVSATLVALPGNTAPAGTAPAPRLTLDALIHDAASGQGEPSGSPLDFRSIKVGRLTEKQVYGLVRADTGIALKPALEGFATGPASGLDIFAGVPRGLLNVVVTQPGAMNIQAAACSAPVTATNGAQYQGPCSASRLADGSALVIRSGTARGGYAIALAVLVRPDGTAAFAAAYNQHQLTSPGTHLPPREVWPPISTEPPVSSGPLAKLVQDLAAQI